MTDQKNMILAIVLSALVLLAWQYFFGIPQLEKQRQQTQQQAQQQTVPPGAPAGQPQAVPGMPGAPPAPAVPGAAPTPPQPATREAVLAASARVPVDTPRLKGSIALKGGRIDDLALTQYRVTVDPRSPPIILLSPSGSPEPFYAEFG
ncbi:MAG TPA: membrane protein insertase YidC, partial [Xanthobacteraceae bacterium]|nr:membrane protein insertase YidC [Xanthobacteraceae bacterium]